MRLGMGWMLVLIGAVLISAQDQPKPQPKPLPMPQPGQQPKVNPRSPFVKKFDDVLDAKDKIVLKHEEEIHKASARPTDLEGNVWLQQLRMNFIRAKIQGDDSSVVKGIRMIWHVSPVPFVKGSTREVRQRMDTLGPDEIDALIRLLEQLEKAVAQKEPGFQSASFTTMGLQFIVHYSFAEQWLAVSELDPEVENHPIGKSLLTINAKTGIKELIEALRRAKQKMDE